MALELCYQVQEVEDLFTIASLTQKILTKQRTYQKGKIYIQKKDLPPTDT